MHGCAQGPGAGRAIPIPGEEVTLGRPGSLECGEGRQNWEQSGEMAGALAEGLVHLLTSGLVSWPACLL